VFFFEGYGFMNHTIYDTNKKKKNPSRVKFDCMLFPVAAARLASLENLANGLQKEKPTAWVKSMNQVK
jgi:hypothetical protein